MCELTRCNFSCGFCDVSLTISVAVRDGIPDAPEGFSRLLVVDRIVYACDSCFAAFSQLYALYERGQYELAGVEIAVSKKLSLEERFAGALDHYSSEFDLEKGSDEYNAMVAVVRQRFFPDEAGDGSPAGKLSSAIKDIVSGDASDDGDDVPADDAPELIVQFAPMYRQSLVTFIYRLCDDRGIRLEVPDGDGDAERRDFGLMVSNAGILSSLASNPDELDGLDCGVAWHDGLPLPAGLSSPVVSIGGFRELDTGMQALIFNVLETSSGQLVPVAWFSDMSNLYVKRLTGGSKDDCIAELSAIPKASMVSVSINKNRRRIEVDGHKLPFKHFDVMVDLSSVLPMIRERCRSRNEVIDDLFVPLSVRFFSNDKLMVYGDEKGIALQLLRKLFGGDKDAFKEHFPETCWQHVMSIDTSDLSRFDFRGIDDLWRYNTSLVAKAFDIWLTDDHIIGSEDDIRAFLRYLWFELPCYQQGVALPADADALLLERVPDLSDRFTSLSTD